jgi:hypothetical protein
MVTDDETIIHKNVGNLSISFYPFENLTQRAKIGDLFLCHVLREGQPLYDSSGIFDALNSQFELRKSYDSEKQHANDIAWLIVKFTDSIKDSPIAGRRLAWCVRTILIACSAENGHPVFSARELAEFAPQNKILDLIAQKDANSLSPVIIDELKDFLSKFGSSDPLPKALNSSKFVARFRDTGNTLGLSFLEASIPSESDYH